MLSRLIWLFEPFMCSIVGHDWDYGELTKFDGTPYNFRCCIRCERTEELDKAEFDHLNDVIFEIDTSNVNTADIYSD